jgi:uncharacterized protein (DUF433 family)
MQKPVVVTRVHGKMSGAPCFRGTRVDVQTLFVNLSSGMSLDEIIEDFPTLDREDCRIAIAQAGEMLAASAPWSDE